MQSKAKTPNEYIQELPEDRKAAIIMLRNELLQNLPAGFVEAMSYGMVGYVVPHSLYPSGYHCKPEEPLPFAGFANQKNFIAFYHMGIYADPNLMNWFIENYPKHTDAKLDMGKSCIRFKHPGKIPFKLFGELISKVSVNDWIATYEAAFRKTAVKK
jgi:hypothetical protein